MEIKTEKTDVFSCPWAREINDMESTPAKGLVLLEYAMHLRMYGEKAPGGNENWRDWDFITEEYLRAMNLGER